MCFHDMREKIKLWRQQKQKKISGCRGEGRITEVHRISRAVKLPYDTVRVGKLMIQLSKSTGCATPRVKPNVR